MQTTIRPVALTLLVLLAGCIDLDTPLSDPENAKVDKQLAGLWKHEDGQDIEYLIIGTVDPGKGQAIPKGMMVCGTITRDGKTLAVDVGKLLMFPTLIGNRSYLNVIELKEQAKDKLQADNWKWNKDDIDSYSLFKYEVKEDRILLFGISDGFKKAIRSGEIKGTVKPLKLTDTTSNMHRFFEKEGDRLFESEAMLTYIKND